MYYAQMSRTIHLSCIRLSTFRSTPFHHIRETPIVLKQGSCYSVKTFICNYLSHHRFILSHNHIGANAILSAWSHCILLIVSFNFLQQHFFFLHAERIHLPFSPSSHPTMTGTKSNMSQELNQLAGVTLVLRLNPLHAMACTIGQLGFPQYVQLHIAFVAGQNTRLQGGYVGGHGRRNT